MRKSGGIRSMALLTAVVFLAFAMVTCILATRDTAYQAQAGVNAAGPADMTLLGLDTRDYSNRMSTLVPLSDRQWVRHHKIVVRWSSIHTAQNSFNWSYYDQEVNARLADGSQSILLLLQGPTPGWARDPAYGDFADKAPPQNLNDWYVFCRKVAERYGSVVDFYEVWNEPGWDRDSYAYRTFGVYHFGGQVETDYLPMLQLADMAIKEKDPTAQVMCGALIDTLDQNYATGADLTLKLFDEVNRPGQDISVKVTAGKPIVAERPMYFNYKGAWNGGHDVLGATAAGKEWYFAEGTTRGGFEEWLCLQNPNATGIQVTATYMFGPGQGENLVKTYGLQPNSRTTLMVNNEVGAEKDVSIKLTSASDFIAERPMYFNYQGAWNGGHDVLGATSAGKEWYFAEGTTRGGFDEWLCLQNPSAAPIQVTATFMFGPGQGANQTETYTLDPTSRTTFKVNDLVGAEKDVSIKLSSASDFIAERPMYFNYQGTWAGGHDVVGSTGAGKEWYFAEGTTRNGFDEWLCLQNPNAAPIQVTFTFMFGPGQGDNQTETFTLDPTSRTTFKVNDLVGPEKDVSVKLTSAGDFIAERPMYFNYGGSWNGGHDVVGAKGASTTWYFAEGVTGFSIQEYLCLQNPNAEGVTAELTFMMTKGEVLQRTVNLAPNSRTTFDINMLIGFHGSSDEIAIHPYKNYWEWGEHYTWLSQTLQAHNIPHELAVTEAGWPHYKDTEPTLYSEEKQAEAIGAVGVGELFAAGCKKIWIYRDVDEDPGTSWDANYYGLFKYTGQPHPSWSMYIQWQMQLPSYPNLPATF